MGYDSLSESEKESDDSSSYSSEEEKRDLNKPSIGIKDKNKEKIRA